MNNQDYHYFVLNKNSNVQYSFTGYTNDETGELWQIFKGRKDKQTGEDIPHRWKFDKAHRTIRVHKNDKSVVPIKRTRYVDGEEKTELFYLPVVDFLRNMPECKGSPNGQYRNGEHVGWKFSEVREEEDAITALDAKELKNKAVSEALNLDDAGLVEMAVLYGINTSNLKIAKHRLVDQVESDPAKFLERLESVDRSSKALLLKAVQLGAVKKKGTIYTFGEEVLGHDEDSAISKIMSDSDIEKAIRMNVKTLNK